MAQLPPLPPPPPSGVPIFSARPTEQERRAVWSAAMTAAVGCETFDDFETAELWANQALDAFDKKFGLPS